ncbi:MAG: excinuclease ABC subunit UvrC [Caldilineaceae bacterium]|nr:excinuclease ABC subunit UvrC [Caldilineaceae bacterium]
MTIQIPDKVAQKLDNLPDKPGCYQMLDKKGKVIYVGKALVLRNRVRSYFHASAQRDAKTSRLVSEIADLTWWVTSTELEALILENELIKRYKPHYNIKLKDDRQFPYIKVHWQDDFPKVSVVRRMQKDGARYFGPYSSSRACYQTMDALRRVFPYLDCDREITGNDARPCLYYHIKLCGGPCIGKQNRAEYRKMLQQMMNFLQGDSDNVLAQMESQMEQAAENLQFELAAIYRDRIKSAQRIVEQQKIISAAMEDADYIAVAQDARTADAAVQVFTVRNGRLIGRENYILEGATLVENGVVDENSPAPAKSSQADERQLGMLIGEFIQQFYDNAVFVPKLILVQALPHNSELTEDSIGEISSDTSVEVLEAWLSEKRGSKVELRVPRRGAKRDFMEMAQRNASEYLRVQQALWAADTNRQTQAVTELQDALGLANPPSRIECFDVSTFQGTNTVGSMVVFGKGAPLKGAYKRFKIRGKGAQGEPDDFASMREMLRRRFRRAVEDDETANPGKKGRSTNESWRILPDLVIIDGGKGQLGIAVEVLQEFELLGKVPIVGLAKREEEVFRPGESQPIWLKRGSGALHLVQRVRDEAHRFAITYHRNLRSKEQIRSKLDDIPGIGPSRRKALLKHYGGDLDKIRNASVEELSALDGISRKVAETIKERL